MIFQMNKADKYFINTIKEIDKKGKWSKNPRTKWSDGSPANYKKIHQKSYVYNIEKGEYPIQTYRKTALKGAFYDIEAIYIKQTNIIEEMNPSIHSWWTDFVTEEYYKFNLFNFISIELEPHLDTKIGKYFKKKYNSNLRRSIGQTYGHTVKRYDLMNKVLYELEHNPDNRRILMNLWQEEQRIDDPKALVPCAYMTNWSVRDMDTHRLIDLTLTQRSCDFLMTASINPAQYVMLGMMVCNHLTHKTGIKHTLGIFKHDIQDVHIYDRHLEFVPELLEREPSMDKPTIELICEPKDFYSHTWEDFKIIGVDNIKPLSGRLEIAI